MKAALTQQEVTFRSSVPIAGYRQSWLPEEEEEEEERHNKLNTLRKKYCSHI